MHACGNCKRRHLRDARLVLSIHLLRQNPSLYVARGRSIPNLIHKKYTCIWLSLGGRRIGTGSTSSIRHLSRRYSHTEGYVHRLRQ
jgi:hypothetical protein